MSKLENRDKKKWTHKILPAEAQAELRRAAETPVTDADPLARSRAIDQALRKIKSRHPEMFQRSAFHED